MRVVTWNVNGIRARGAQVVSFLDEKRPSALLLQEIKATPEQVPADLHALAHRAADAAAALRHALAAVATDARSDS